MCGEMVVRDIAGHHDRCPKRFALKTLQRLFEIGTLREVGQLARQLAKRSVNLDRDRPLTSRRGSATKVARGRRGAETGCGNRWECGNMLTVDNDCKQKTTSPSS